MCVVLTPLPNNHLQLACDSELCRSTDPLLRHGVTEHELLEIAEGKGWDLTIPGIHLCPSSLHTLHDCSVCGGPARNGLGPAVNEHGEILDPEERWYCDEHFQDALRPPDSDSSKRTG